MLCHDLQLVLITTLVTANSFFYKHTMNAFRTLLVISILASLVSLGSNLPIRLVGGKHHYEGKLEVLYKGKWGEICDHHWSLAGARVACRMLGFPEAERFTNGDRWGRGTGYFWLDDVQCKGNEESLELCKRKDWGRCNCKRGETAGVVCSIHERNRTILPVPTNFSQGIIDLSVRLYGPVRRGYISEGALQVNINGRWGYVCTHGWIEFNSRVACGMLGYVGAVKTRFKVNGLDPENVTYVMSKVKCSGRESSLVECTHQGWWPMKCPGGTPVVLVCRRSKMLQHPSIRLRGSYRLWEGRIEVKSNAREERLHWGTVCDDGFNLIDANVACRTLGLGTASRVFTNAKFGQGVRRIYMDDVQCNGWEKNFFECSHKVKTDCTHYEDVSIRCNAPDLHGNKIRLVGGRNSMEGFVEMYNGTNWGAVCGDGWGIEEAVVTCRQLDLGFGLKAIAGKFDFGMSSLKIEYSHLDCALNQVSLFHCSRAIKPYCRSSLRAGVYCTKALPDLVVNVEELERHVRVDAIPLNFLRCSYEENCLAASARRQWRDNRYYVRRLLRFTTRIENRGLTSFVPDVPRSRWQWHECHAHYHSMEVFSSYDLVNRDGMKIAAGHKASFCLEDTICDPGLHRYFNCTDGGPQGVSPNCYDVYKWNIDCQWIDVTDHEYGTFYLRVVVNPDRRVPESDYLNNIAKCELNDYGHFAIASNCRLESCESGVDTHGGNSNGACCVFPFKYQGNIFRSCTTYKLNQNWCATTSDFDRDQRYGICY